MSYFLYIDRQTRLTASQMIAAPERAVYVWPNGDLRYPKRLAEKHSRTDLILVAPSWLSHQRFRGLNLSGIVVDHACRLTDVERDGLREVEIRIACGASR